MKKFLSLVVLLFSFTIVFAACMKEDPAKGGDEDQKEDGTATTPETEYILTIKQDRIIIITLPIKYNEIISTLPANPIKIGYSFDGYYIENVKISNGDKFNFKNDVTAISKFSEIIFKINLNSETGNSVINYTINSGKIILPVLEKIGYSFAGWFETADFSGAPITKILNSLLKDLTLFAKFDVKVYKINLNSETGNSVINYTINSGKIILPVVEKEGSTFVGWFENSDYSGEVITHILSSNLKNYSLYAKFEQNPPEITYTKIVLDLSCSFNAYMLFDELGFKTDGYTVEFNVSSEETLGTILYQKSQSLGLNLVLYLNDNYEINNMYPFEILSNENFSFKQLLNEECFFQNEVYFNIIDLCI